MRTCTPSLHLSVFFLSSCALTFVARIALACELHPTKRPLQKEPIEAANTSKTKVCSLLKPLLRNVDDDFMFDFSGMYVFSLTDVGDVVLAYTCGNRPSPIVIVCRICVELSTPLTTRTLESLTQSNEHEKTTRVPNDERRSFLEAFPPLHWSD